MNFLKITLALLFISSGLMAQNATEIVKKANEKVQGEESSYSTMTMKIVRPTWDREITFKSWSLGTKYSMVYITAPAKEKGQVFLKRDREMWNWNPSISRMIKLPPSMLSQGWMGSDFTNDDLLNQSSIVVDYDHKITGSENINSTDCYKIALIPHEDAPVVWGKIEMWISKDEYLIMKALYYDEDEYLVKTEKVTQTGVMDGRIVATQMELVPADEEGHKTVITITELDFDIATSDAFFSQQNMKRVR